MDSYFEKRFEKDLKKITDKNVFHKIRNVLTEVKQATNQTEITQLKKLKGYETFYRIRCGDYRLGIEIIGEKVIFTRCLHRKEIYRYFPKD